MHLLYTTQDSTIANYVYNLSHVYFPEMPIHQNWLPGGDSDYSTSDVLGVSVNNMDQAKRFTELNLGLVATLAGLIPSSVDDVTDDGWSVYPNPTSGMLIVKGLPVRNVKLMLVLWFQGFISFGC